MTVMEAARMLGSAIQEDPRFAAYQDASAIVANDEQVKALNDNLQALQDQFNAEAVKEQPDENLLNDLQQQGSAMYQTIYQTPAMTRLMDAKEGMDAMMNEVMNFLYLVIGGADPKTVEVTPETMQQMQAEMMQMQQ